jgi:hypothetical protein
MYVIKPAKRIFVQADVGRLVSITKTKNGSNPWMLLFAK